MTRHCVHTILGFNPDSDFDRSHIRSSGEVNTSRYEDREVQSLTLGDGFPL